jgi:dipeptidyl aminopeptidase/acylaminoacyl peptidase
MYKPFDFDPNRKYPIIACVYPGPQTESVTAIAFEYDIEKNSCETVVFKAGGENE